MHSKSNFAVKLQMSDIYEFPNDPEEQEEAKKEEDETLALTSSFISNWNDSDNSSSAVYSLQPQK